MPSRPSPRPPQPDDEAAAPLTPSSEVFGIEDAAAESALMNDPGHPGIRAWARMGLFREIANEASTQYRDHGRRLPKDPLRRVALITEEAGEALKEALNLTRTRVDDSLSTGAEVAETREAMRREIVQCASMCLQVLSAMQHEAAEAEGNHILP